MPTPISTAQEPPPPHRGGYRHRRGIVLVIGCLALLTALIVATIALAPRTAGRSTQTDADNPSTATDPNLFEAASIVSHPNYRYSVIPGGAHTPQDLVEAIQRDTVVAAHYQGVSLESLRVERLPEEKRAYVSYRIGDRVYWTKEKVRLPSGEPILTDGITQIRARCGNCISYEPQLPTLDEEPATVEFDALIPSGTGVAPLMALSPGTAPSGAAYGGSEPFNGVPGSPQSIGSSGRLPLLPGGAGLAGGSPAAGSYFNPADPLSEFNISSPGTADADDPDGSDPGAAIPGVPLPGTLLPGTVTPGRNVPDLLTGAPGEQPIDLLPYPGPGGNEFGRGTPTDLPPQPVPVPEPSSMVLLGTGVAGALWRRIRSRKRR